MHYVLRLIVTVLIVASQRPVPTAEQVEQRERQERQELQQAKELADRYTEELLGLRSNE